MDGGWREGVKCEREAGEGKAAVEIRITFLLKFIQKPESGHLKRFEVI